MICSGSNQRQIQAIADEVGQQLKKLGERPKSVEGYQNAEWILMDYGDYVVNVFSAAARSYYDLERLWRVWVQPSRRVRLRLEHGQECLHRVGAAVASFL